MMIACGRMAEMEEGGDEKHKKAGVMVAGKPPPPLPPSSSQPAAVVVEAEGRERKRLLVEDLEYLRSPSSWTARKNVVIVMDALKEFSTEALEWALAHIVKPGSAVTLIGAMPWLNFILSTKTSLDVWTLDLDDLHALRERTVWRVDVKYQKIRAVIELCEKYGVVPNMKVAMGEPLRLIVLEHIISLHATWVVFDRHQRRDRRFYSKRIPCNMMMMKGDGELEILKMRPMMQSSQMITPGVSPALAPSPQVLISKELMEILKSNKQGREECCGRNRNTCGVID